MKKRYLALALALILALSACGSQPAQTTQAPTNAPAQTTQAPATTTKAPAETTAAPAQTTAAPAQTTAAPETTEAPEPVDKVYRRYDGNPTTLNPYQANAADNPVMTFTQARLYRSWPGEDGVSRYIRPELAESEPIQMDTEGKVWQIKVKKGLTFTDWEGNDTGKPINANVFEYSFRMSLDPKLKQRAGDQINGNTTILNAKEYFNQTAEAPIAWEDVGIKAIDEYTLEIKTAIETNANLIMRTFYGYSTVPVDPELYASHISEDGTTTTYGTDYNTCYYCGGCYACDWTKESLVSLKKNPNYVYADEVNFTEVYLHTVSDNNTKALMFENGELDFITLDEATAEKYNESPYYVPEPSRYVLSIEFGDTSAYYERTAEGELILHDLGTAEMNLPLLADMNFKKAIFYAINRTELANLVHLRPATGLIPDTSVAYDDGTRFCDTDVAKSYRLTPEEAYNPELAKQCFEQAMKDNGYGPNDKLTVELLHNTITLQKMAAAYMQQQLPKVFGEDRFELTLNELADTPRLAQMKNWRNDRNPYQIAFTNWSFSNADEMPIRALTCYSPSNYARTNSGTHCEAFEEIIYTLNTDARLFIDREYGCQKAGEAEKLALENYLAVPLIGRTTHYMVSDKILLPIDPELGLGFFDWLADLDVE